ncbi:3170_t:CDS:2, partial [Gigaspora rosea]
MPIANPKTCSRVAQAEKRVEKIKNGKGLNIEQVRVLEGCGRKAAQPTLEKELLEYIKKRREEKGVVTISLIIKKAKAL